MTDLSTAPASQPDSPEDHDAAEANGTGRAVASAASPDTVASVLGKLEGSGWRSLHALTAPGQRAIDHVAIGPGGIFVIDDHILESTSGGDPLTTTAAIPEAAISAANQLADAIRQLLPPLTRQYVVPVLATLGQAAMSMARGPVQICTTSMLARVIESRHGVLSGREVDEVVGVLSAGLREGIAPPPPVVRPVAEAASSSRKAGRERLRIGRRGAKQTEIEPTLPSANTAPERQPTDSAPPATPEPAPAWLLEAEGELPPSPPPIFTEEPALPTTSNAVELIDPETAHTPGAEVFSEALSDDVLADLPQASEDRTEADEDPAWIRNADLDVADERDASTVHLDAADDLDVADERDASTVQLDAADELHVATDAALATVDDLTARWSEAVGAIAAADDAEAESPLEIAVADDLVPASTDVDGSAANDEPVVASFAAEQPDVAVEPTRESGVFEYSDADPIDDAIAVHEVDAATTTETDEERRALLGSFPVDGNEPQPSPATPLADAIEDHAFDDARVYEATTDLPSIEHEEAAFSAYVSDDTALSVASAPNEIAEQPSVLEFAEDVPLAAASAVDIGEPLESEALPAPAVALDTRASELDDDAVEDGDTPIKRSQAGGRRRAPTSSWHSRFTSRTRDAELEPSLDEAIAPTPEADPLAGYSPAARDAVVAAFESPRAASARPRTLSTRTGKSTSSAPRRKATRSRRAVKRTSPSSAAVVATPAADAPTNLSSRGRMMYAAMNERRALEAAEAAAPEESATRSVSPMRRMVTVGVAAALLVVSAMNVASISQWVSDHVPGVGQTDAPGGGNGDPGRTANLHSPNGEEDGKGDGGKGDGGKGDGGKHSPSNR